MTQITPEKPDQPIEPKENRTIPTRVDVLKRVIAALQVENPTESVPEPTDTKPPEAGGIATFSKPFASRIAAEKQAAASRKRPTSEVRRVTPQQKAITRAEEEQYLSRQLGAQGLTTVQEAPWTLQQFFNGEIDLDIELTRRFPNMPLLSLIKFRNLGSKSGRRVAAITAQDGSSALTLEADVATKEVQLSFTWGSMLTFRFALRDLSAMDRNDWLEKMQRQEGLAFLWGQSRWSQDYLICVTRKYYTNIYAFSPNRFEAAVRWTPLVTQHTLKWLEELWTEEPQADDEPPPILTW